MRVRIFESQLSTPYFTLELQPSLSCLLHPIPRFEVRKLVIKAFFKLKGYCRARPGRNCVGSAEI